MDDVAEHAVGEAYPSVSPEVLKDLEDSRRLLFDDDYIPDYLSEAVVMSRSTVSEDGKRRLDPHLRAFMAMNNFYLVLSEKVTVRFEGMLDKPLPALGGRSITTFLEDKNQILEELGLPAQEIKKRAMRYKFEPDKVLGLYQETFPVFEKLVKEKGYTLDSLRM